MGQADRQTGKQEQGPEQEQFLGFSQTTYGPLAHTEIANKSEKK